MPGTHTGRFGQLYNLCSRSHIVSSHQHVAFDCFAAARGFRGDTLEGRYHLNAVAEKLLCNHSCRPFRGQLHACHFGWDQRNGGVHEDLALHPGLDLLQCVPLVLEFNRQHHNFAGRGRVGVIQPTCQVAADLRIQVLGCCLGPASVPGADNYGVSGTSPASCEAAAQRAGRAYDADGFHIVWVSPFAKPAFVR